ncbi:MAG: efflux RND transporter periplasmic adaptor subunit [Eubacteriales bacterium]
MNANNYKAFFSKKRILAILLIVILCFLVFRIVFSLLNKEEIVTNDVVNIKITKVISSTLENTTPIIGRVTAKDEVSIIPKVPGQVENVYVAMGDKVSKGDRLFDIDSSQIEAGYTQANDVYLNLKLNFERVSSLYNEGAISKQQMEQTKLQYENSQQSLAMAQDSLSATKVTSPISGYVTSIIAVKGGLVSQAMPAVTISNIDTVQIKSTVSENLINKINVGDKVNVLISAISEKPFVGTITALSPSPANGSLTYPLIATLDNSGKLIKPGMSVEIILVSAKKENAIVIPSGIVMIKGGKTVVAVIDDALKVSIKDVKLGIDNGEFVEVLEGLSIGEKVVTVGQQYLNNESKVKIIE